MELDLRIVADCLNFFCEAVAVVELSASPLSIEADSVTLGVTFSVNVESFD